MKTLTPFPQTNITGTISATAQKCIFVFFSYFATTFPVSLDVKRLKPNLDPASSLCWPRGYGQWLYPYRQIGGSDTVSLYSLSPSEERLGLKLVLESTLKTWTGLSKGSTGNV